MRRHRVAADCIAAEALVHRALAALETRGYRGRAGEADAVGVKKSALEGWRAGDFTPGLPQFLGLVRGAGFKLVMVPLSAADEISDEDDEL